MSFHREETTWWVHCVFLTYFSSGSELCIIHLTHVLLNPPESRSFQNKVISLKHFFDFINTIKCTIIPVCFVLVFSRECCESVICYKNNIDAPRKQSPLGPELISAAVESQHQVLLQPPQYFCLDTISTAICFAWSPCNITNINQMVGEWT